MSKYGPKIFDIAELASIVTTVPSTWATGYPKITFSYNLQATDADLPVGVG
jgi:hypothetical protein